MNGKTGKVVEPKSGQDYLCVIYDQNDVSSYFRGIVRVINRLVEGDCLVKIIQAQAWGGQRNSKPGLRFSTSESSLRLINR